jgi:beta-glucanase (GH16 family)
MSVVFFDDFEGSSLGPDWTIGNGFSRNGTNETEWYETGQVSVANSILSLTATCLDPSDYIVNDGITYTWLSGDVEARNVPPAFLEGTIAWSAKCPSALGMWPALWLLNNSTVPPEIDVMEGLGLVPPTKINSTYITSYGPPREDYQLGKTTGLDLSAAFHTYRCDWLFGNLTFWVDDILVGSINTTEAPGPLPSVTMGPLMNLAVASQTNTYVQPVDPSTPPGTEYVFEIDWVRIEQNNSLLLSDEANTTTHYRLKTG